MASSDILADPPTPDDITPYDEAHFVTYLRLLDAEKDGAHWEEATKIIFDLDISEDPERAERIYRNHLRRAKWMTTNGYAHLLKMSEA